MTTNDENKAINKEEENLEHDLQELQEEMEDIEENENIIDKKTKKNDNDEIWKLKELLARTQADYQNFKFRSERDREDMVFFIKHDILKKILPRIDDLERIIKNTPEQEKTWTLFEWISVLEKSLKKDIKDLWVKSFTSIWKEVNPDFHEVMTQIPSKTPWIIIDEFEKWYLLWDKILRIAKVVVWA